MTVTETSVAHPIDGYVWCDECDQPHEADFDGDTPVIHLHHNAMPEDECAMFRPVYRNVDLPADWENEYVATYSASGKKYDLWLRRQPLLPCHHPMYYLEKS